MRRIEVDRSRCTGLGICESIDPDVFEIDDDGTLLLRQEIVDDGRREVIEEAVRACPTRALRAVEP